MKEIVVELRDVSKQYRVYKKQLDRIRDSLFPKRCAGELYNALQHINLAVYQGEIVGLIGCNGSGKSTLCKIISQMTKPTTGTLHIKGHTYLLTPNAGMIDSLTGIENIYYKCLLMGFDKKEIEKIKQPIIDFAEIGEHIHYPLKTYSSGMRARLGFAISVQVKPDILIVDEALAVGDSGFHRKCREKMDEYRKEGKTIFFISHSVDQMLGFCHRVIWLHNGKIIGIDQPENIIAAYKAFIKRYSQMSKEEKQQYQPIYEGACVHE